jgi:TatD DNase family protein
MLVDTHSHIYDSAFDPDRAETIARARKAGVAQMLLPATDSESHEVLLDTCREYPGVCLPMMGLHPTSVNDNPAWREELALVERYLAHPPVERFYAVGEIGLDLHWSRDFLAEQTEAFEHQIELALEYSLPVVIHTRDAWTQMRDTLAKYAGQGLRGVMHAFSGTLDDYRAILDCGDFAFGIGGPVTYKNSALARVVGEMDIERILLETDCPYLPPVPHRGGRNESGYLTLICEKIAEIKGLSPHETARITTENARRVFGL